MSSVDPQAPRRGPQLATDIVGLSRVALQEALWEISAASRQTRCAVSSRWRSLVLDAEAQLGIEVNIEDPAQRELFGYLIQVEALLGHLRSEASELLRGAQIFSEGLPATGSAAAAAIAGSPRTLGTGGAEMLQLAEAFSTAVGSKPPELQGVTWHVMSCSPNAGDGGSARYRAEHRLKEEVLGPIHERLAGYADLRSRIRDRQRRQRDVDECLLEVAARQSQGVLGGALAGLRPLMVTHAGAVDRLRWLQAQVAELDEEVLGRLLEVREAGCEVARLSAALAHIRAEFFATCAAHWGPMATALAREPKPHPGPEAQELEARTAQELDAHMADSAAEFTCVSSNRPALVQEVLEHTAPLASGPEGTAE